MSKLLIALAAVAALTIAAQAQSAGPSTSTEKPAPADAAATPPVGGDTANQETYKMKDGGMYQPPAQRPASPAQDLSVYGRT